MATVDLAQDEAIFSDGYDGIVVVNNYTSKRGGVTLDVTGYPLPNIRAGHVIIKETSTGEFKPMPLNGTNDGYGTLPGGHTYYGHAVQSVRTADARVGVMYHGEINDLVVAPEAGVFDLSGILSDLKTALPHMMYTGDNA